MSLNKLTTQGSVGEGLTIFCKSIEANNIVIPQGGDITTHNLIVENDLNIVCQNLDNLKIRPNTRGNSGQVLTSLGNGNTDFTDVLIQNPLASNLNIGSFDITGIQSVGTLNGIYSQQQIDTPLIQQTQLKTQYQSAVGNITTFTGGVNSATLYAQNSLNISSDWKIQYDNLENLKILNSDGYETIIATSEPIASQNTILSNINYGNMLPISMLANITESAGGINKCWGHTETYIANENLLAGRIVSLTDTAGGTDGSNFLKVGYLLSGIETVGSTYPIGITQNNALLGQPVRVCVRGYTSAIVGVADTSPNRGSTVISGLTASFGKIFTGTAAAADQARIGFVAQSNPVILNNPCLIFVKTFFTT